MSDLTPPNIPALPSSVDTSVRRAFDALRGWFSAVTTRGGVVDRAAFADLLQESNLNTPFSDGAIPPKPQNVVVSGAFRTIIIEWDDPRYKNLAHAEIWRSPDSSLSNAQLVGTTNASLYSDTPPNASLSVTYTYWVRFVSIAGINGPFSDSASGSTADDPAYVLELLVGEITESELDQSLSQRITRIETNAATAIANIGTITTSDFTDASTYNVGALVKYQGEIYKCITDINSTPAPLPTDTDYWVKVGQYASLADMVSATASGLTSLDTRTDAAEGTIDAHSTQITALETTVNDPVTGVDATASGLTALDTRVTSAEGTITTNSTAITNLSGRMTTAEGGISSQGSAINLLDVRLTSAEGTISSQSSDVTLLDSRLTTAEGTVSGHSTAISNLETRVTDTEGDITAQASQISGLTSRMGTAESAIVSEASTRASADSALTSSVNQLFASTGANTAAIQTEQLVRATTTGPNWASGTTYAAGKVVIYGGALYQCISSHYSSGSNAPPNSTYWKSVTASLYSQYTVKTDVNGYVAGFGLANDGVTSSFRVRADVFSIGSPGYPDRTPFVVDTVNGRVVMNNALINNLTSTNIAAGSINVDRLNVSELWAVLINAGMITTGTMTVGRNILSSNFVSGVSGWGIDANGYAEFNNVVVRGRLEASTMQAGTIVLGGANSTKYVDAVSGQQMLSVATRSHWVADTGSTLSAPYWSGALRLVGPNYHATNDLAARLRNTSNGVVIPVTITVNATADHFLSIWYRYNGGTWVCHGGHFVVEIQNNYGAATMTQTIEMGVSNTDYIDFGVRATNQAGAAFDAGKTNLAWVSITVQAVNI